MAASKEVYGAIFGTINNTTLIAVPLFILMGTILEKSRIAEALLDSMARLFGSLRGGLDAVHQAA